MLIHQKHSHLSKIAVAGALLVLVAVTGCSRDLLARPGLKVTVVDSVTGENIVFDAMIVARDGTYSDSVRLSEWMSPENREFFYTAELVDRPGTYTVTVRHDGYITWTQNGVRVPRSGDSSPFDLSPLPKTIQLHVKLDPVVP